MDALIWRYFEKMYSPGNKAVCGFSIIFIDILKVW